MKLNAGKCDLNLQALYYSYHKGLIYRALSS